MKKIVLAAGLAILSLACNNSANESKNTKEAPSNNDSIQSKSTDMNGEMKSDTPRAQPAQNMQPDSALMRRPHQ